MNDRINVRVPQSDKGFYQFRVSQFGYVEIETGSNSSPDFVDHYHTMVPGTDRGATAVVRLLEEHKRLREFFEAARQLSITELFSGRLEGFLERGDIDPEQEDAWELVSEMIQEADAADEAKEE